ncbi:MAG: HD domain-containing protein [Firmicutes bacterium]|nr:HD domain-containing protein [Bacillota bacterium]
MKEHYAAYVKVGEDIQTFFLLKSAVLKTGSNGKQYLDLLLGDYTGDLNAKKWDVSDDDPEIPQLKEGQLVKIKGQVTEFNGQKQLRVQRIRRANDQDGLDKTDYIKAAPEPAEDMFLYLLNAAEKMEDEDLKKLCVTVLKRNEERFLYYPAATRNHHAELAGLLWHMKRMAMTGEAVCRIYTFLNRDLLIAGVILHDTQKLNEIESNELGVAAGYSFEGQLLGHLVMGVREIEKLAEELGISREKTAMLEHMVLSHHYEPEFGSPKKPMFAEAEMLHYLDIVDARMYDFEEAVKGVEPGTFSEKVWTLDNRRIYRANK